MMKSLRAAAAAAALLVAGVPLGASAGLIQQQRAQRAIDIVITVQAPIVMRSRRTGPGWSFATFISPALLGRVASLGTLVAVNQGAIPVKATVIADPNANLLVLNKNAYAITQTSGTTATYSCAFTVSVNTTITHWTIDDALASDFGTGFSGTNLAWSIYTNPGSPPATETFTGYVVYPSNNNAFQVTSTSGLNASYCVDLRLSVPAGLAPGTYSATAIYSLYY